MAVTDEADRQRFLETLRSDDAFRATVRRDLLTQELLELPQTVAEIQRQMVEMRADISGLRSDMSALVETVHQVLVVVRDGFAGIGAEIAQLRRSAARGFATHDARFDQVDAAITELRGRLAS